MKLKIFIGFLSFAGVLVSFSAGAALFAYLFFALEMNDRLKYEVAYLNGYTKIQSALKAEEYEKASAIAGFYIDAHAHTLYEFEYLSSSEMKVDMQEVLCRVIKLRKEHPRSRSASSPEIEEWNKEVKSYLSEDRWDC